MLCARYDIFCCIPKSIILNIQNSSKNKSNYILNILPLFCEKRKTVLNWLPNEPIICFLLLFFIKFSISEVPWLNGKGCLVLVDLNFLKILTKSGWINIWDIFEFVSKYHSVKVIFGLVILVHQSKIQFE